MNIEDVLQRKQALQAQLHDLSGDIEKAKAAVLKQFASYSKEFDITLAQVKALYESAPAPAPAPKAKPPVASPARKERYYCEKLNKWFSGYQHIPAWFDISKADTYLLPGKIHSPLVKKAMYLLKQGKTESEIAKIAGNKKHQGHKKGE